LKSMTTHHSDFPVLDTYQAVVSAFSDFLTVAIHTILYERNIYPQTSFISARKYNYPVKQSRHPKVCKWVQDAVAAVEVEMLKVNVPFSEDCVLVPFCMRRNTFVCATKSSWLFRFGCSRESSCLKLVSKI